MKMSPHNGPHNIIIFGEAGCGKSSLVNMMVGTDVAKVSSEPLGCTFRNDAYLSTIDGTRYCIYDTAGLNEGDQGRVPHWTSVRELYMLIRKLDGVSLLIYCVRGRIKENTKANWILFNKVICGKKVPAIAVFTGLENEKDWEDPSRINKFKAAFEPYNIKPKEIVAVVSIKGKGGEFANHYETSQKKLRNLIARHHMKEPWSTAKDEWFASIYHTTYKTGICFSTSTNVEFTGNMRGAIGEFVKATSMSESDRRELEATLVQAEKKVLGNKGRK